jgi:hypothetical protein
LGTPGKVVPAEVGDMTLLEYCNAIKLDEASQLLRDHGQFGSNDKSKGGKQQKNRRLNLDQYIRFH